MRPGAASATAAAFAVGALRALCGRGTCSRPSGALTPIPACRDWSARIRGEIPGTGHQERDGQDDTSPLPSDTKLLLTKSYFEIIIFEKLRTSRVISGKSLSFLDILRVQIPSKITKNNFQGIIFAIISRQRVRAQRLKKFNLN